MRSFHFLQVKKFPVLKTPRQIKWRVDMFCLSHCVSLFVSVSPPCSETLSLSNRVRGSAPRYKRPGWSPELFVQHAQSLRWRLPPSCLWGVLPWVATAIGEPGISTKAECCIVVCVYVCVPVWISCHSARGLLNELHWTGPFRFGHHSLSYLNELQTPSP